MKYIKQMKYLTLVIIFCSFNLQNCIDRDVNNTVSSNKEDNINSKVDTKSEMTYDNTSIKKTALTPKGVIGNSITITSNGVSRYTILIPNVPSSQEEKAAQELQKGLLKMTNVNIPIIKGSTRSGNNKYFSIGQTKLYKNSNAPRYDLKDEGYSIYQKGDNLFFTGGLRRGPINAVIAFLEEDLGCRWYAKEPSSHIIPKRKNLTVSPVTRKSLPAFEMRELMYADVYDEKWGLYNKMNAARLERTSMREEWGGYTNYPRGWAQHTTRRLIPANLYYEDHPEYFAQKNDVGGTPIYDSKQICWTNDAGLKIATKKILTVLNKRPAEYISVSQNDGRFNHCKCGSCKKSHEKYGISGTNLRFVNKIADEVKKYHPNTKVSTLAYYHTFEPPINTIPNDNVFIVLCTNGHWARRYEPVSNNKDFKNSLNGWKKLGVRLHVWDYPIRYSEYLMPFPTTEVFADNLKYYRDNDIKGVIFQGKYHNDAQGVAQDAMKCWVYSKLMWNPDLDVNLLMKDFIEGYYGDVSAEIWEIHNKTAQFIKNYNGKIQAGNPPFPVNMYEQFTPIFQKAYRKTTDPNIKRRIESFELSYLYFDLKRDKVSNETVYKANLKRFEELCLEQNISVFSEKNINKSRAMFLEKSKIKLNNVVGNADVESTNNSNNYIVDESNLKVRHTKKGQIAPFKIIENNKASNGFLIQMNEVNSSKPRLLQKIGPETLEEGQKYKVTCYYMYTSSSSYSKTKNNSQAKSLAIGLWLVGDKNNRQTLSWICKPNHSSKKVEKVEVGVLEYRGNSKLQFTMSDTKLFKEVYIDRLVFEKL